MSQSSKPLSILLVDDSATDIILVKRAFKTESLEANFTAAKDGVEAVETLREMSADPARKAPDLILLDINMPRMDGKEVLEKLKQDADTRRIPVIMLTTSSSCRDVADCYDRYASAYIVKPDDLQGYSDVANSIRDFWAKTVELPPRK